MSIRRLGLITSQAFSICNFRGPLIREWVASGVEVLALAPDYDDSTRSAVAELGAEPVDFELERATIRPLRDARHLFRLLRLLRRLRLDATVTYFIKPVAYGTLAARLVRVPHRFAFIEGSGYLYSDGPNGTRLRARLLRLAVNRLYKVALHGAEAVFFLNREDRELFLERDIATARQAVLIGGIGVDLEHFAAAPPVRAPVTFLMAARLLVHKGVHDYVEAARWLQERHPGARFVLLGSPDLNPASVPEETLRRWHAAGIVEWQPHVPDVRPWLRDASVLVLPSFYREGVPRSIQEAMAMGRPVITTDMPGCRDTVEAGVNGFIVPPRDPPALAAAMERFIVDPGLVVQMGQASRERAERLYDVRRANRQVLAAMGLGRPDDG